MGEEKLESLIRMAASRVLKLANFSIKEYEESMARRRKMLEDGKCPAGDVNALEVSQEEEDLMRTSKAAVRLLREYHGV